MIDVAKYCKYCGKLLQRRFYGYEEEMYCDCEQANKANLAGRNISTLNAELNKAQEEYDYLPYLSDKGKEFMSLIKQRDKLNKTIQDMEFEYGFSEQIVKKWCW